MGISKILINLAFSILLFGSFFNCKPQQKNVVTKKVAIPQIEKDTFPKYPTHLTKEYVLGKFDYKKDSNFIIVPKEYSSKKIYVRKEVLAAFVMMNNEAKKDDISFKIISGTRNFAHQKRIWDYKWNVKYKNISPLKRAEKILEYSSMPSISRHHWGTDIDLNSLNNSYFSYGKGQKEYNWLVKNGSKFGFYQAYASKENGRTGYNEEKWHWSYIPLSSIYLKYYNEHISYHDILNFEGAEFAKEIDIIKNYVNGINSQIIKNKP